ncbi:hypothetical protein BJY04DRAFT_215550 [Aspergillus karnatakaensis]|uniref:uncharacterized protein n=1 Tax=Aspergillus karnatakaensis TaxID=1810916 RepID=UPI003CCCAA1A
MTEATRQFAPRTNSPSASPMSLRHRGLSRAATINLTEGPSAPQRRNSAFSDSVSEARNTIRSSTDELLFPRATRDRTEDARDEESHWHSAPLGLALLPAVAGIFFQNGSAFVTDVTLLALAAVFLNWSVRLPWEWYRSARTIRHQEGYHIDPLEPPIGLDTSTSDPTHGEDDEPPERDESSPQDTTNAAVTELQIHELAALASCFIFPLIGTWILHTIRSNLSRPSEGLVSNYNLTIFLLAAEIRPFSHLLRMVQTRTLHLQRIITDNATADSDTDSAKHSASEIQDLTKRLEEIEAHIASRLDTPTNSEPETNEKTPREPTLQEREHSLSLINQAISEYRKGFQSDIDALNRAVRRYEKRTTVSAYETESRLQSLELKIRDALSLAAAAQRSSAQRYRLRDLLGLVLDWTTAAVLLPVNVGIAVASLPVHLAKRGVLICRDMILPGMGGKGRTRAGARAGAGAGVGIGPGGAGASASAGAGVGSGSGSGQRTLKKKPSSSSSSAGMTSKGKASHLHPQSQPQPLRSSVPLQQKRPKRAVILEEE